MVACDSIECATYARFIDAMLSQQRPPERFSDLVSSLEDGQMNFGKRFSTYLSNLVYVEVVVKTKNNEDKYLKVDYFTRSHGDYGLLSIPWYFTVI